MKWIAPMAVLSALVILLGSCRGTDGETNAPACDTVQSPTCHIIMVTQSNGATVTRYYVLHIPANFPQNSGALVVSLHGTGEGGLEYERHTQLDATADQNGFAIAYPDALLAPRNRYLRQWNFYFNGAQSDTDTSPDDVAFLRQLITTLRANLQVDPKKIYVSGVSAGGLMAVRVGVELSDLVAAIAPLSGSLRQGGNGVAVPAAGGGQSQP